MQIFQSNFFYIFSSQAISGLFFVVSLILLTRTLGPEQFGIFALFKLTGDFFFAVCVGWSSAAVIRYGSEEMAKEEKLIKTFFARSILVLVSLVVVVTAVLIFRFPLSSFTHIPSRLLCFLLIFYACSFTFSDFVRILLQAGLQFKASSLQKVVESALFPFLIFLVLFIKVSVTPVSMAFLLCLSMLAGGVSGLVFLKKQHFSPMRFSFDYLRRILSFSLPVIFLALMGYCVSWVDIFVIRLYLSSREVGIYHAAYTLMRYLDQIPASLNIIMVPYFVQGIVQNETKLISFYSNRLLSQWMFIFSFLTLLFFLAGKPIILLFFGKAFYASYEVLLVLLSCVGMRLYAALLGPLFNAYEMTRTSTLVSMVVAATNILLDFLFVPYFGIYGAAYATGISFSLSFFLYGCITMKRLHLGGFLPFYAFLAVVLCCILVLRVSGDAQRVFICFFFLSVQFSLIRLLKIFTEDDILKITELKFSRAFTLFFFFFYTLFTLTRTHQEPERLK